MNDREITVAGAGILGLWQALTLARRGHSVRVLETSPAAFASAASRWAGAMIAPDCEAEAAPDIVRDLGRRSYEMWLSAFDGVIRNGTLVTAAPRDLAELSRFARATEHHTLLDEAGIAKLEPDLAGRFSSALYFPEEAHFDCMAAMDALLEELKRLGVTVEFGAQFDDMAPRNGVLIDCRGLAARDVVKGLRGVRGERLTIATREVNLSRPVRLLHPRQPIYVVPQGGGRYVVGATVIEREDDGPMTVRSALELLGSAYALHPAFAEAAILDMGAGVRPAFADNVPRALVENSATIRVNGAYRHGFLLSPILAEAVADYLGGSNQEHPLIKA